MADTNIGWTDKVWNPTVGCSRVSAGCENCYAETFANRLEGMGQARYKGLTVIGKHGARWTGEVRQVPEVLAAPLRWRKGRRVFVNSMSDLFHEAVPFEYVAAVFGVMAACPQHTFQVLTKRPERALEWFTEVKYHYGNDRNTPAEGCRSEAMERITYKRPDGSALPGPTQALYGYDMRWPLPNVHLGVSVEDQGTADKRIPLLLRCPAAVRWISAEPLLGPVRVDDLSDGGSGVLKPLVGLHWVPGHDRGGEPGMVLDGGKGPAVSWVVSGGESGAGHRSVDPAWLDSIVAQCTAAGVPVFVKQDSGPKPGKQGRLSDATWSHKEFPALDGWAEDEGTL